MPIQFLTSPDPLPQPGGRWLSTAHRNRCPWMPLSCRVLTGAIHEQLSEPQGFMLYDLRAACSLHTGKLEQALDDAMYCTKLNPEW